MTTPDFTQIPYQSDYPRQSLADWQAAIPLVPDGLAGDDIHPNPSGGVAYANSVQAALDALLERNERPKPKRG